MSEGLLKDLQNDYVPQIGKNQCEHGSLASKCEVCELKAEVKRLTKTLREVRDIVPQICQVQLGGDCNCAAVTHIIDNVLQARAGGEG